MESPSVEVRGRFGCSRVVGASRYGVQAVEEYSTGAREALYEISGRSPRRFVTDEAILHALDSLDEVEHLEGIV